MIDLAAVADQRKKHALVADLLAMIEEAARELGELGHELPMMEQRPAPVRRKAKPAAKKSPAPTTRKPTEQAPAGPKPPAARVQIVEVFEARPDEWFGRSDLHALLPAVSLDHIGKMTRLLTKEGKLESNGQPTGGRKYRLKRDRPAPAPAPPPEPPPAPPAPRRETPTGPLSSDIPVEPPTKEERDAARQLQKSMVAGLKEPGTAPGRILEAIGFKASTRSELAERLGLDLDTIDKALEDLDDEDELMRAGIREGEIVYTAAQRL